MKIIDGLLSQGLISEVISDKYLNGLRLKIDDAEYLIVFSILKSKYVPMSVFLNTVDKVSHYKEFKKVFYVTDASFHIDHINAVNKKDIENMIFIHKETEEDIVDRIKEIVESN